jgi:5-methylcytosine-specific restriction endonuclease McrA
MKTELESLSRLSDQQLTAQVILLARCEREATASLVAHLAEFGARKLYLGQGCASLFTYCTEMLHLSEHAAYLRITAARLSRRFPVILDKLERGTVNLTTLKLLRKVLAPENHARVLAAAEHQSKRDVETLVANLAPQPAVKTWIRKLPVAVPAMTPEVALFAAATSAVSPTTVAPTVPAETAPPKADTSRIKPAVVEPLAPELYKIQFTASEATHAKLRRAQELMRHQIPNGDPAAVFDRALTLLVAHLEKTKLGATNRPRAARPTRRGSRHIPAGVRRAVWERNGGRCAFTSADGKRCSERGFSEFHHVHPHGDAGEGNLENIELRCRAHNQYEADVYFGPSNEVVRNAAIQKRKRPAGDAFTARESPAPYGSRSQEEFGPDRIFR